MAIRLPNGYVQHRRKLSGRQAGNGRAATGEKLTLKSGRKSIPNQVAEQLISCKINRMNFTNAVCPRDDFESLSELSDTDLWNVMMEAARRDSLFPKDFDIDGGFRIADKSRERIKLSLYSTGGNLVGYFSFVRTSIGPVASGCQNSPYSAPLPRIAADCQ